MHSNNMKPQDMGAPSGRKSLYVERAADALSLEVDDLYDAVTAHAEALSPLLSDILPEQEAGERKQGECEVAEYILTRADRVREAVNRIRSLTERL